MVLSKCTISCFTGIKTTTSNQNFVEYKWENSNNNAFKTVYVSQGVQAQLQTQRKNTGEFKAVNLSPQF